MTRNPILFSQLFRYASGIDNYSAPLNWILPKIDSFHCVVGAKILPLGPQFQSNWVAPTMVESEAAILSPVSMGFGTVKRFM